MSRFLVSILLWLPVMVKAEVPFGDMALQNEIPNLNEVVVLLGQASATAVPTGVVQQLVVWNIYKTKRPGLLRDLSVFSKESQFLVLQETILNRQMALELVRYLGFAWQHAISFFQRNGDGTGVVTGSVYETSRVDFVRSRGREPITGTPKMAVITEYPIDGRDEKLVIANIHALNFVPNSVFRQQLEGLADKVRGHHGPLIVAGDFNTHHNDRFLVMAKIAENLGLHLVALTNDRRLLRLDHVLVRGVEIVSGEVLVGVNSSDHFPVRVRFKL